MSDRLPRRDFVRKVLTGSSLAVLSPFTRNTNNPIVTSLSPALSLQPDGHTRDDAADSSGTSRLTSGPLLDWFYIHAGYTSYRTGSTELWDVPQGIEIVAQPAEKSQPLIVPDRPWEQKGIGYTSGTYYKDGKYIMHYFSYNGYHCIAESENGFKWTKPELGLIEFEGSNKNNIVNTPVF